MQKVYKRIIEDEDLGTIEQYIELGRESRAWEVYEDGLQSQSVEPPDILPLGFVLVETKD